MIATRPWKLQREKRTLNNLAGAAAKFTISFFICLDVNEFSVKDIPKPVL